GPPVVWRRAVLGRSQRLPGATPRRPKANPASTAARRCSVAKAVDRRLGLPKASVCHWRGSPRASARRRTRSARTGLAPLVGSRRAGAWGVSSIGGSLHGRAGDWLSHHPQLDVKGRPLPHRLRKIEVRVRLVPLFGKVVGAIFKETFSCVSCACVLWLGCSFRLPFFPSPRRTRFRS